MVDGAGAAHGHGVCHRRENVACSCCRRRNRGGSLRVMEGRKIDGAASRSCMTPERKRVRCKGEE
jgi:hypothetical protein